MTRHKNTSAKNNGRSTSSSSHKANGRRSNSDSSNGGIKRAIKAGFPWAAVLGTTALAGAAGITWLIMKNKDTDMGSTFARDDMNDESDRDYTSDFSSGESTGRRYSSYGKRLDDTDDYSETYGGVL